MQKILWGISALEDALAGSRKVLLVCDSSYPFINIGPQVESAISGVGSPLLKFSDFASNPLEESVLKGVDLFVKEGCDTLVAVGGGSSIDVAKCIKLYAKAPETKLIAIPTTAGTGSESTRFAVIYAQGKKQSVTDDSIVPDFAILEPSVLESLPLYQKKCTMMDALCQGIESWWSVNATDESREYSRKAIETIMTNWEEYIFGAAAGQAAGSSAAAIMLAANYAGRAINITQTTAPHAFSYKLTSLLGLPHGHAVALCLPEIWKFMLDSVSFRPSGGISLMAVFTDIAHAMGTDSPETAITLFRSLMSQMELGPFSRIYPPKGLKVRVHARLEDISCQEKNALIDTLASSVNPIRLANNPVPISEADARTIYSKILL